MVLKQVSGKMRTYDVGTADVHLWDFPVLLVYINGLVDG